MLRAYRDGGNLIALCREIGLMMIPRSSTEDELVTVLVGEGFLEPEDKEEWGEASTNP